MMNDGGCVSSEFPIVMLCGETVALTSRERGIIDVVPNGAHESRPTGSCDLAAGHTGPHYCIVQGGADDVEMWLTWDQDELRELRLEQFCPLNLPLAESKSSETTGCRLFAGHPGPHQLQCSSPDLWWWGDVSATGPKAMPMIDQLRQLCATPFDILEIEGDDGTITNTPVVRAADVIAAITDRTEGHMSGDTVR